MMNRTLLQEKLMLHAAMLKASPEMREGFQERLDEIDSFLSGTPVVKRFRANREAARFFRHGRWTGDELADDLFSSIDT